jgi:hypothetical protein
LPPLVLCRPVLTNVAVELDKKTVFFVGKIHGSSAAWRFWQLVAVLGFVWRRRSLCLVVQVAVSPLSPNPVRKRGAARALGQVAVFCR